MIKKGEDEEENDEIWRKEVGKRSHSKTLVTIMHTVRKFPLCEC
jgi:hypothetical protein